MPTAGDDGAAGALPHLPSDPERSEPADRAAGVARRRGAHRNADPHPRKGVGGIGVGIEVAVAAERVDDRLCSHPTPHETNTAIGDRTRRFAGLRSASTHEQLGRLLGHGDVSEMAPVALLVELRIGLDLRRGVVATPRPGRAAGRRRVVARAGAAGPPLVDPVAAPVICPAEAAVRNGRPSDHSPSPRPLLHSPRAVALQP